jgi:Leucine-rich repeat (LRR) protein
MNLAHNQLRDLPKEFQHLKNLKTLILAGNPMDKETIQKLKELMPQTQIYF